MFVFGHLGFGHQLAAPWRRALPAWPLAIGMLLPDLIDKPLYYARMSDYISATRSVGHTGLLCLLVFGLGYLLRRRALTALGLGMATHLLLDCALDWLFSDGPSTAWIAVSWPLYGGRFADVYIASIGAHAVRLLDGPVVGGEVLGIAWLWWDARRRSRTRPPAVAAEAD